MGETTLQAILRRSFPGYARRHRLPPRVHKAVRALTRCRTAALGGHTAVCANGHVAGVWYNSCRHRFCPQCSLGDIEDWLERKKALLPPVGYRHLTFTIPHEYLPLWRWNRQLMADLLFDAAQDTIRTLVADPRWCGGLPGILIGLHTWSSQLLLHPHVHALVTEGGVRPDGTWCAPKKSILLPKEILRTVFRGKFQHRLEKLIRRGRLSLPPDLDRHRALKLMKRAGRQEWIVDRRDRYDHGAGVATYLARYMRGGPLKNHQLIAADDQHVRFRYVRDKSRKRKSATLELSIDEFFRRLFEHVPVPGMHLVRAFGLFHPRYRDTLKRLHDQLGASPRSSATDAGARAEHCGECGAPFIRRPLRPSELASYLSDGSAPPSVSLPPRSPPGTIPISARHRLQDRPREGRPTKSLQRNRAQPVAV